jgi:hypothetical protein
MKFSTDLSEATFISTKQIKFQRGSNAAANADQGKSKDKSKKKDYTEDRKRKRGE